MLNSTRSSSSSPTCGRLHRQFDAACREVQQARALILTGVFVLAFIWTLVSHTAFRMDAAAPSPSASSSSHLTGAAAFFLAEEAIPAEAAALSHLVLVAGHAVLTSLDVHDLNAPSNWELLSYQKDQVSTFVRHIQRGVELTRADPTALLIFSGGETRQHAGPRSEAQSYWMAAEYARWWQAPSAKTKADAGSETPSDPVSLRATTEEYARDSYENLMFALCRFKEFTGAYPKRVTVVGFEFKRARFRDLHRAAVRFPLAAFAYEGIDPPEMQDPTRKFKLIQGEQTKSVQPFQQDPYGCMKDGPLYAKKLERNPFRRHHSYELVCPELVPLLRWCQGPTLFPGDLPWDSKAARRPSRS